MKKLCLNMLTVAAAALIAAQASAQSTLSASQLEPQATPDGRVLIGRGEDYVPAGVPAVDLFASLKASMPARRDFAWDVVEKVLKPITLEVPNGPTFEVPLWLTWYEGRGRNEELRKLMELYFVNLKAAFDSNPDADIEPIVDATLQQFAQKDIAATLDDETFDTVLNQNAVVQNLDELTGRGTTIFSPSFIRHMMLQAKGVMTCDLSAARESDAPRAPDQFSHCIDEFPPSAVMVKTAWRDLDRGVPVHDTSAFGVARAIRLGTWPSALNGYASPPIAQPTPDEIYTVETASGRSFALTGIHFVTKDVREWVWVSLWWDADGFEDFGEDKPDVISTFNDGVWENYKMCVNSSFVEGDPAPWSRYARNMPSLAASLRATQEVILEQISDGGVANSEDLIATFGAGLDTPMFLADAHGAWMPQHSLPTTWCSNPNIEVHGGNARTNCIGCHQVAFTQNERRGNRETSFIDAITGDIPQYGRAQVRRNFPAEFSWSFGFEYRSAMLNAAALAGFEWPE